MTNFYAPLDTIVTSWCYIFDGEFTNEQKVNLKKNWNIEITNMPIQ